MCEEFYTIRAVIPAIVLAAGKSSRMGRPKATLPLDGRDTFLTRIVRTFTEASVDDVVVVVVLLLSQLRFEELNVSTGLEATVTNGVNEL